MRPLLLILALALIGLGRPSVASAQQPPDTTTISSGSLPGAIRLTGPDHDAFVRRLDLPPLFDQAPRVSGPSFAVRSPYWDEAVRDGDDSQPRVDETATYYPEGGFVLTKQGGKDVWTALDTKQKAILDRYIRLGASLPAAPAAFELLRAAAANETIGIIVGQVELTPEQRATFWQASKEMSRRTLPVPAPMSAAELSQTSPSQTWIVFNLPESRSVRMLYSGATGTLVEPGEIGAYGIYFPVPADWLVPVLGDRARIGPGYGLQPLQVPQDEGHGSPVWWLIAIGGGLASLSAAVYLQRRISTA